MTRFRERNLALELRRKQHLSYSQIREIVKVSKSTLSEWLRDYPLSRERVNQLRANSEIRIEKFRETWRRKREKRLLEFYKQAQHELLPLNKKELFIAGLFLYWGEGSKTTFDKLCLSNSDPSVIKFFLYWLTAIAGVPKSKIKVFLQLYKDMDVKNTINYWSKELSININQFGKPYIKESTREHINHKGFAYGTCSLTVNSTLMKEKILMEIKSLADFYGKKTKELV